jgi:hypothetical protein
MSNPFQGTDEWFKSKLGKVSASHFGAIMVNGKGEGGLGVTAIEYMEEIIAEYMTGGNREDSFKTPAMQHGSDYEESAIYEYEKKYFQEVELVGFLPYKGENELLKKYVGCSPDGLSLGKEVIEVKCLKSKNHVHHLLNPDFIVNAHKAQTQGQLLILKDYGYEISKYLIFDPRVLPEYEHLKLQVKTRERDEEYILKLEQKLFSFCTILDNNLKKLGIRS